MVKQNKKTGSTIKPRDKPSLESTQQHIEEGRVEAMRMKKNKIQKSEAYHKLRGQKIDAKRARRMQRKADIKQYGAENCPVQLQKSQDDAREKDVTIDDVPKEEMDDDEFASYFKKEREPKVMLTTGFKPGKRLKAAVKELKWLLPNSKYYTRRDYPFREICRHAISGNFTDVVCISADPCGTISGLIVCHLPNGPTARYRVSNFKLGKEIPDVGERTGHYPELFLKNFETAGRGAG